MGKNKMNHRDLMQALVAGNDVPRPPVALWRHFPVDDQYPERLANATSFFQQTYDLDLIKVSPSSSFCIRDWGIKDAWHGNTEGTRDYLNSIQVEAARTIRPLDPKSGSLGNQLKALDLIATRHLSDTPVIQTIFNPLSQLKNLLGKQHMIKAIRHTPGEVAVILDMITETTSGFMKACLDLHIDGFFFAVQHATSAEMSREEFINFGIGYDARLFRLLEKTQMNILHIHGRDIYFDLMLDYPCQIINWHDRECQPSLSMAKRMTAKVLCGGLSRVETMVRGAEAEIEEEISDTMAQIGNQSFLLGTGCVLPIITPHGNIKHAVEYARTL